MKSTRPVAVITGAARGIERVVRWSLRVADLIC